MNKAPLVLLHGYPFDHGLWEEIAPALAQDRLVLAPDLTGFGLPVPQGQEPSLDYMADQVSRLLIEERVSRALIAGFSMGGYVALSLAERHAGRIAGLALINSQAAADSEETRSGRRQMIKNVQRAGPAVAAQGAIAKMFAVSHPVPDHLAQAVRAGADQAGAAGISWALEAMARRPDRTNVLRNLRVPVLIVHSVEDQFIPVEKARALAAGLPHASYVEIANAGHATPLEVPRPVASAMINWLKTVP